MAAQFPMEFFAVSCRVFRTFETLETPALTDRPSRGGRSLVARLGVALPLRSLFFMTSPQFPDGVAGSTTSTRLACKAPRPVS